MLEEQFAQVRLALRMKFDCSEHWPTVAALSAIERHVQDMETALDEAHELIAGYERAALPAREKGTE